MDWIGGRNRSWVEQESELKARFPGGVGKGLDPAVVQVAATVEDHLLDALRDGSFGHELADGDRGVTAAATGLEAGTQLLINGGRRAEGALRFVVDDLGVDVIVGAEHGQPRAIGRATEMTTQTPVAFLGLLFAGGGGHGEGSGGTSGRGLFLAGLARFAQDALALVFDALALVGLRGTNGADFGGFVAYQLLVDAGDDHLGVVLNLEGDAVGRLHLDRVAVAGTDDKGLALDLGSGAHTDDFQTLAVTVADPFDHVGDEGAAESVALP